MKTLTPALKAHLQQEVTTIATIISLLRNDGKAFFLTDHDEPINYDNQTYVPYDSYSRTSILMSSELEVDSSEINAFLNSSSVTRDDVASGLFDYALIRIHVVNYETPAMGAMLLRRGTLGEVVMNEDDTFTAEIRGMTQVLTYRVGEAYGGECRVDLGDKFCKIALNPKRWENGTVYAQGDVVLGKIGAGGDFVNCNLTNPNFEDGSPDQLVTAPEGWVRYGDVTSRWVYKTTWYGLTRPQKGDLFIAATRQVGQQPSIAGLYQDVDLVDQGVPETALDTGLCRASFKGYAAVLNNRAKSRVRLTAFLADDSTQTIYDSGEKQYGEDRWVTVGGNDILLPTGTRRLRIDLWSWKRDTHEEGCAYDGFSLAVNLPDGTFENADEFGGVMFKCIQAGTSGETEPAFTSAVGDETVDNTVIWQCIENFKKVDTVATVLSNKSFAPASLTDEAGHYDGGLIYWETGQNAGRSMEVKSWAGGVLTLFQRTYYPMTVTDRFVIYPGCDKRRATCADKFGNIINFRAEPDVPGQDILYRTPNAPEG